MRRSPRAIVLVVEVVVAALTGYLASLALGGGSVLEPVGPGGPAVDMAAFAGHGDLAFVSRNELYVLDGTTQRLRQVTAGSPAPSSPLFSHDGRWLAFLRPDPHGESSPAESLWLADADGAGAHRVADLAPAEAVPNSGAPVFSWSPTGDELLVTTLAPGTSGLVDSLSVVPATGRPREIATRPRYGAVWSPDGHHIALIAPSDTSSSLLESVPSTGGRPTTWGSFPGAPYYVAGWSANFGILLWDDKGGGGPSVENYGLVLAAVRAPGAALIALARSPIFEPPAFSFDEHRLAVVANVSGLPDRSSEGEKFVWFGKTLETCAATTDVCRAVVGNPEVVTEDPAVSPRTGALAFVEAPVSRRGLPDGRPPGYQPSDTWTEIAPWYATHSLWLDAPGATSPTEVPGSSGAGDPLWSADSSALLYVKGTALWLVASPGAAGVEIAANLTSDSEFRGTYVFGYVDWSGSFAWSG